jgi:quinol monooxygenase YgiN
MIAIVFTFKVKEGMNAEFEAVATELSQKVRAGEPGNLLYQLVKSRADPNSYKFMELYKDADAVALHRGTDHYKSLGPKMGACFDGRGELEILDAV